MKKRCLETGNALLFISEEWAMVIRLRMALIGALVEV